MKKIILPLIMGVMLLSNVVVASAATSKHRNPQNNITKVSTTDSSVYHIQTEDPSSW